VALHLLFDLIIVASATSVLRPLTIIVSLLEPALVNAIIVVFGGFYLYNLWGFGYAAQLYPPQHYLFFHCGDDNLSSW
jgi:hypothetical protein